MSTTKTNQTTVFLDNLGRIIIGKVTTQDKESTTIENPALVHIQPHPQSNQLQLQLLPLFFREFQADKGKATSWKFRNANMTPSIDLELSPQLIAQYEQIFALPQQASSSQQTEVVKLFDEEEEKK